MCYNIRNSNKEARRYPGNLSKALSSLISLSLRGKCGPICLWKLTWVSGGQRLSPEAVCILTEELIAQVTPWLMTHVGHKFYLSLTSSLPPPNTRIVAGNWQRSASLNKVLLMASNLPVRIFSAGNYKDTFSFAKGFFYPRFLSLEEKKVEIRPRYSQAILRVHSFAFIKWIVTGSLSKTSE